MTKKANYRKINDRSLNSSIYHKKDLTNIRAKLKEQLNKALKSIIAIALLMLWPLYNIMGLPL